MEFKYRLRTPLFFNFVVDDVPREEVVTHVTLQSRMFPPETAEEAEREYEAARALHARIDFDNYGTERFDVEEMKSLRVQDGLTDAYNAAGDRAMAYCRAKAEELERLAQLAASRTGAVH
jgi:hypothetical protein